MTETAAIEVLPGGRPATALSLAGLEVRFGGVVAVWDVTLSVPEGQLLGIIGANGAGKTTLFDAISGLVPHGGRLWLGEDELTGLPPQRRARAGLGRSFQDARLFPALTVREALTLAVQRQLADPGLTAELMGWRADAAVRRRVDAALELFGLGEWADRFTSELSTGTRRVTEIASVYVLKPRVILLDEPATGIAQREVEMLAEVIRRLRRLADATLLLVEHDVPLVRSVADRIVVMEAGRVIADGVPDTVLESPRVITSYLGTDERALQRSGAAAPTGDLVEVGPQPGEEDGDDLPVPGLPERDDFHIPWRSLSEAGAVAVAALAFAAFAFVPGSIATPGQRSASAASPPAAGTPVPAPGSGTAPAPLPVPPLPGGPPLLPLGPVSSLGGTDLTIPPLPSESSASPQSAPTPSPTPSTCPVGALEPLCAALPPVPRLPVPLPARPPVQLGAGEAWRFAAGGGFWSQLPSGWPTHEWGADELHPSSRDQGTLIAWQASRAGWSQLGIAWWGSPARQSPAAVLGPLSVPWPGGPLTERLAVACDGSRCFLAFAVSTAAGPDLGSPFAALVSTLPARPTGGPSPSRPPVGVP